MANPQPQYGVPQTYGNATSINTPTSFTVNSTSSNLPPEVQAFYNRRVMQFARSALIHDYFAVKSYMPQHSGTDPIFVRYAALTEATTPLTEAVTPAGSSLTRIDLKANLKQYGSYIMLSDLVSLTVQDNVLNECARLLGYQAALSFDSIIRSTLASATSVVYASGGVQNAAAATPGYVTLEDIRACTMSLMVNKAWMISSIDIGSVRFNSQPVRQAFFAYSPTELRFDYLNIPQAIPSANYGSPLNTLRGELCSIENTRILETTAGTVITSGTGATADKPVYESYFVGKDAYATSSLGEMSFIYSPLGSGGANDPLSQRQSCAWKAMFASVILNQGWIVRLVSRSSSAM